MLLWHPEAVRQRNSERKLEQLVREDEQETEPQGVYELFPRDEDAALARDDGDDEDG